MSVCNDVDIFMKINETVDFETRINRSLSNEIFSIVLLHLRLINIY